MRHGPEAEVGVFSVALSAIRRCAEHAQPCLQVRSGLRVRFSAVSAVGGERNDLGSKGFSVYALDNTSIAAVNRNEEKQRSC